jgi:hypothetical protein
MGVMLDAAPLLTDRAAYITHLEARALPRRRAAAQPTSRLRALTRRALPPARSRAASA